MSLEGVVEDLQADKGIEGYLLDEVMHETNLPRSDEAFETTRRGIGVLLGRLVNSNRTTLKLDVTLIDAFIAEIDEKLGKQLDCILHNEAFQEIESAWRGLKQLIDRVNFQENIKVKILDVSKEELYEDFEDYSDITKSGLYRHVYTTGFGQFGGEPVGAIIGNYYFSPINRDVSLLRNVASVSAMAHAPFLSAVSQSFFSIDEVEKFPNLKDIHSVFESPLYDKWRGFRETEDSRYVGLTFPRYLLRSPYGEKGELVKKINYEENVSHSHDHYLWGNAAFLLATRLTESFAKYRWCPNIIGPRSGGSVENLATHYFESMGELEAKIPTEVLLSDRREYELAEQGFIGLTMKKGSDTAVFFSANSCQKPKKFSNTKEGKQAETNFKLGTQLPYLFVISRLAHYIKVLQREQIGSWKGKVDLQRELGDWIRQYVSDQENPTSAVRSRRPLRKAEIRIFDVEGDPGWYKVELDVVPHFKYMGANFTLSLKGKLDKE